MAEASWRKQRCVRRYTGYVGNAPHGFRAVAALGLLVLGLSLAVSPASAHKASVFAAVQGKAIRGETYFRDGAPIRNAQVTVFGPAGEKLGETRTDQAGKFAFQPDRRCDHRFMLDGGDGHAAEFTVRAEELPAGMADASASPNTKGKTERVSSPKPIAEGPGRERRPPATKDPAGPSRNSSELRAELEAIQTQIIQLRRDLAARDDATRWRDLLGGIGYLLGLMGLSFYFLGVRRKTEGMRDER